MQSEVEQITIASNCEKCGAELVPPAKRNTVMLERSVTNGRYYARGSLPPAHASAGVFPFCRACAKDGRHG